jgi:3-hydroxyisobutyrate dehydrogenase
MSAGKIVVDQTSGLPAKTAEFARRLALSGIGMIDAPVAGGVPAALAGSITVMVSGPDAYVETASPVLAAISPKVFRCSDRVGDGQAAKLVNNSINSGYRMATLELVAMGSKLGLPLAVMTDALNMGWGSNFTALRLLTSLVRGQPSTNFAMSLMLKDLDQCIALGMEAGAPMPVTTIARGLMQIALNMQGATAGLDEVVPAVEAMYGASLHQPTPSVRADGTLTSVPPGGRYGLAGAPPFPDAVMDSLRIKSPCVSLDADYAGSDELPSLVIDFMPRSPAAYAQLASELAVRGSLLLDAASAGRPDAPFEARDAILHGGTAEAFEHARPFLDIVPYGAIHCGAPGQSQIARLVVASVAACNRALVYENAAVGMKLGLRTDAMATLVNEGSGWSSQGEIVLTSLASGRPTTDVQLETVLEDLRSVTRIAMANGAPLLIVNAVRALFEAQATLSGPHASLDALKSHYEVAAGITFAAA